MKITREQKKQNIKERRTRGKGGKENREGKEGGVISSVCDAIGILKKCFSGLKASWVFCFVFIYFFFTTGTRFFGGQKEGNLMPTEPS